MALGYDHYVAVVRRRERDLRKHSAQIGRLCTLWSSLELDVTTFLTVLSPFADAAAKNVLMGSMDFRSKLVALLALGFKKKPFDKWYADLEKQINLIDNTLRTARNRMVHDFWFTVPTDTGKPEVQRVHLKPKVVNEQAFKKRLQLADMKVISAAEIAKLCDSILDANAKILELQHQFEWSPLHGISQQLIPPRSPLQGRAKKAPPPPPKP